MPTTNIVKPQTACRELEIGIKLKFPPETIDAEGTTTWGAVNHLQCNGVDEDGNQAASVWFPNDEVPAGAKQAFIQHVLIPFFPDLLASEGISLDLTPTPYVAPEPEPTPEPVEEPAPDPQPE